MFNDFVKFGLVVMCFIFSLCYRDVFSKKDVLCLRGAMLFTVLADYCLLVAGKQITGVLSFCLVQLIYALRYGGKKNTIVSMLFMAFVFVISYCFNTSILHIVSAMYATAFIINIVAVFKLLHNTTVPYYNRLLMFMGMILFAACDINVALYNAPWTFTQTHRQILLFLIWFFYLPSQLLLAVSAKNLEAKASRF